MLRFSFVLLSLSVLCACGSDTPATGPDADVIEQLRQAGSDLSKPHPIEFFLYFPDESAATAAYEAVEQMGFSINVQASASTSETLCLATKQIVPTNDELSRLRMEFENIAEELEGEYDGWGTPVVE